MQQPLAPAAPPANAPKSLGSSLCAIDCRAKFILLSLIFYILATLSCAIVVKPILLINTAIQSVLCAGIAYVLWLWLVENHTDRFVCLSSLMVLWCIGALITMFLTGNVADHNGITNGVAAVSLFLSVIACFTSGGFYIWLRANYAYAPPLLGGYAPYTYQQYPPPYGQQAYPPPQAQQAYPPPQAYQGYPAQAQQGYPPQGQQGYPPHGQQGYSPHGQQGYPPQGRHSYPAQGQPAHPPKGQQAPPPPEGQAGYGYTQPAYGYSAAQNLSPPVDYQAAAQGYVAPPMDYEAAAKGYPAPPTGY
jgi:hypothetical protein